MIIDILLAISLLFNVYLLNKYGKLIIEHRNTLQRLTAVSELLTRAALKQAIKPTHDRLETLNENREN